MTTPAQHRPTAPVDRVVDGLAHAAESSLAVGHRLLGRAQLHVHAWRVGRDPSLAAWVHDIERRGASGEIAAHGVDFDLLRKRIDADRSR